LVATQSIMLSSVPTALFTDTNPQENGSRYTATINWGDGTSPSTGSVGGGNGILKTNGSHTYAVAGRFTVTTNVFLGNLLVGAALGQAQAQRPNAVDPDIMLYSLDFEDGYELNDDSDLGGYFPHQWLDKNLNGKIDPGDDDHQYPYAFVGGSSVGVSAVFKPRIANPPAQIWLK